MANIRIFTDTYEDLCRALREKYNIDYVKMCTVQDGVVTPADMDFEAFGSCKGFYDILRAGKRVTTTQVPREEFVNAFTACIERDEEVIYIGCALPLSSSVRAVAILRKCCLSQLRFYSRRGKNGCKHCRFLSVFGLQRKTCC